MGNYFTELYSVNVNDKVEKKNGLSYVSWPFAWAEVKKRHPDAQYIIYERETEYGAVNYFTDGRTCWVKTGVKIEGLEHIEMLPVMDFKNRSIPYESVNSMDVNKAIQRSLTKACARHGLGLYIYAGEDLPEGAEEPQEEEKKPQDIIQRYCDEVNMTAGEFGKIKSLLVAEKLFPPIAFKDMTEQQKVQLIGLVEQRRNAA